MKSFLLRTLGVVVGILLGAALIHALLPRERAREDRRRLFASRPYCQVMLIGPSYANMIVAEEFDAEARRIGLDKRVCKLGRSAMVGYELYQEIDVVLSRDWPKLELVLVDITLGRSPMFPEGNWFKARTVEWHTLEGMKWLQRFYDDFPKRAPGFREKLAHVGHFLAHYASIGRAPEVFGWREPMKARGGAPQGEPKKSKGKAAKAKAATKGKAGEGKPAKGKTARGKATKGKATKGKAAKAKTATKGKTGEGKPARGKMARHLDHVGKLVAWNENHAKRPEYGESRWVRGLRALVKSHGPEAHFVFAPVWYHPLPPADSAPGKKRLVLMRFNDPTRYPELYTPEARGNTSHLSRAGRPIYSRILANELHALSKQP